MEYTELGPTGVKVSRVCLGTVFRSEPGEAECLAAIAAARIFVAPRALQLPGGHDPPYRGGH